MDQKEVRLQWDPDHDLSGNKMTRRAIQLGMKGQTLQKFGKEQITFIEDITDFVREQKVYAGKREINKLSIPAETVFQVSNENLRKKTGIDELELH